MAPGAPSIQELLEAISDGIALVGADGRISAANKVLERLLGNPVVGRSVLEATRSSEASQAAQAALKGQSRQLEIELPVVRRKLVLHFAPLNSGALWSARDVTDAKRMEAARRDFVANASHELRTPVTAIVGAAETLLGGALTDPSHARGFIEMISRHAQRLSHLTQGLLDLSRIESGEWAFEVGPVSVSACVDEVFGLLRGTAQARPMNLARELPGELKVKADRRALEQVLVNLVENAIKHTPAGGTVTVTAEAAEREVTISVLDTGPGIERHHLDRVFERFYRADSGRAREAGGTGLGLSIVKHLVEAQGGRVGVESGPGGSRFWISLPKA